MADLKSESLQNVHRFVSFNTVTVLYTTNSMHSALRQTDQQHASFSRPAQRAAFMGAGHTRPSEIYPVRLFQSALH
jgi:hypothetical protein